MRNRKMLGNGLLLLTAFIWGTAFVFQRAGMDSIEPITFNAARMALSAIAVGVFALLFRKKERVAAASRTRKEQKDYRKNTILGGLCCGTILGVASIFQQMGIVTTTAGKAGFITAMYMLLVPVIGFVFLKKKNTWLVWLAVLLGITGMYFLCITGEFSLSKGDTLVSLCAFCFSFHILACDHFVGRGDPIRISAIQFAVATVISAVIATVMEEPSVEKLLSAAIPILYCGIVSGGVGYTLQMVAQKFTDPTIASLLMSMESVFAVIAGVILLGEQMSSRELMGCILMFTAIVMVQIPLPEKRKQVTQED